MNKKKHCCFLENPVLDFLLLEKSIFLIKLKKNYLKNQKNILLLANGWFRLRFFLVIFDIGAEFNYIYENRWLELFLLINILNKNVLFRTFSLYKQRI